VPFPSIQQFSSPRRPGKIKPLSAPPYVRLDYYFRLPLAKCTCARALYSEVKPAWRSSRRRTRLPPAGGGLHSHGRCLVRLLTWKHRASFASLMLRVPAPLIKPLGHRYFLLSFFFLSFFKPSNTLMPFARNDWCRTVLKLLAWVFSKLVFS